jgi:pimeloyl-ACP methyl ester carboxylesterase
MRRRGVVLLNAGGTHHVGPNRMYVRLARRWARNGYVVMRLDLAGLGDSEPRQGQMAGEVYPADALADIGAALECMRTKFGICDVTLIGLCSGAYHALRAAAAALPVRRVMMINPANFRWNETMTLHGLTWLGFVHNPRAYLQQVLPSRPWRKIITGKVHVGRLIKLFAQHTWLVTGATVRNALRGLKVPLRGDIGQELQAIAARGTEMLFVFAVGDPGFEMLKHETGRTPARLGSKCRTQIIDGADHIFSQGHLRLELESALSDALFAFHPHAQRAPSTSLQVCAPGG